MKIAEVWTRGAARTLLAAAVLWVAVGGRAQACAGTTLLQFTVTNLIPLNLGVAALEALVARVLFRSDYLRAFGIMLLANYFSLICAGLLTGPATMALGGVLFSGPRLVHLVHLLALAVPVSFVLTVLFEWPFCAWLMNNRRRMLATGLLFCVVSQVVTYAVLAPFHLGMVDRLRRDVGPVAADTRGTRNPGAVVYYLDNERGDLWSIRLDGSGRERVCAAGEPDEDVLVFPQTTDDGPRLFVGGRAAKSLVERGLVYLPADVCTRTTVRWDVVNVPLDEMDFGHWYRRCAFDLRAAGEEGARTAQIEMLRLEMWEPRPPAGRPVGDTWHTRIRYHTPFRVYEWRSLNLLPHDEAVASVDGQIVLVDLDAPVTRFLVEGHSPFVVLP